MRPDGSYVALAWPTLERVNAREPYDAELGLLTDTLAEADLGVEAIGNADGTDSVGTVVRAAGRPGRGHRRRGDPRRRARHRPAGARPDPARSACGSTSTRSTSGSAPRGRRRPTATAASSSSRRRTWPARCATATGSTSSATRSCGRRPSPTPTTWWPGCSTQVDPERDAVMLLAPYNLPADRDLTVSAVRAPGVDPGYMRSASTQRVGLPDAGRRGADRARPARRRPPGRDGGAAGRDAGVGRTRSSERVDRLVSLNEASRFREQLLFPTTLAVVVVLGLICAAAIVVLVPRRRPRTRRVVRVRGGGRPGRPADVVPRPRLPARGPGRGVLLGVHRGRRARGRRRADPAGRPAGPAAPGARPRCWRSCWLVPIARRDDRVAPQPQRRVRLLADRELAPVRHQQLLVRAWWPRRPACWPRSWPPGWPGPPGPGRRRSACWWRCWWSSARPIFGSDVGGIIAFTPTILVFAAMVTGYRVRLRTVVLGLVATGGGGRRLRPRRPGPPRGGAGPPRAPVRAGRERGARAAAVDHRAQGARQPRRDHQLVLGGGHPGGGGLPRVPGPVPDPAAGRACTRASRRCGRACGPRSWPPSSAARSTTRGPSSAG